MKYLVLDIETNGLDWNSSILAISAAYRDDSGKLTSTSWNVSARDLFSVTIPFPQIRAELKNLIDQAESVCGHNLSFDLSFLYRDNFVEKDWLEDKLIDTFILSRMYQHFKERSLDALCTHYEIGVTDHAWHKAKENRSNLEQTYVEDMLDYAEKDSTYNLRLVETMVEEALKLYSLETIHYEGLFASVVATMRCTGIPIDVDKLDKLIERYKERRRRLIFDVLLPVKIQGGNDAKGLLKYIHQHNIHSPNLTKSGKKEATDEKTLFELVSQIVNDKFSVATQKGLLQLTNHSNGEVTTLDTTKTYPEIFREIGIELPAPMLKIVDVVMSFTECRHVDKAISTWLEPLYNHAKLDGRIHALYSAAGAASYRLTCGKPGIQAFPALDIWEAHINADYSQAEYRLAAIYAKSEKLAKAFAAGSDAHRATAQALFKRESITSIERSIGKTFNFATLYGAGLKKLIRSFGLSEQEANTMIGNFRKELPELSVLVRNVGKVWQERGYIVLWNGIRLYADPWDRVNRGYMGVNQLCQGGVAQLAKVAMIRFHKLKIPMLGQIHDSIQFPLDVDQALIHSVMSSVLDMPQHTTTKIAMKVDINIKGA